MSAQLMWVAECEVCEKTELFDGALSVEELGDATRTAGWDLPRYGGMFCAQCAHAVEKLKRYYGPIGGKHLS